jgi:hypothetical protein
MRADRCDGDDDLAAEVDAAWLLQWQRDNRFTDARAAAALGLSERAFRRQKSGRSRITQQTYLLAQYVYVHEVSWLAIAELARRLAYVTAGRGKPPRMSDFTTQAKPPGTGSNSSHTSIAEPQDNQYATILRANAAAAAFSSK